MISLSFLYFFLPFFTLLYLILPKSAKSKFILITSTVLIAWAEPLGLIPMAVCIFSGYLFGIFIFNFRDRPISKMLLGLEIAVNTAVILLFHRTVYDGSDLLTALGQNSLMKNFAVIGASVMPLHSMAYCFDVYNKKHRCEHRFIKVADYIAFFPIFAAGPILSFRKFGKELDDPKVGFEKCAAGIRLLMLGMFMKLFISNTMFELWQDVRAIPAETLPAPSAWIGIIAFGFFVYFEVSAFSNIAGGLASLMGFTLPVNFRSTYRSHSFFDFIHKFNCTLYRWCKDHVYNNINRKGNRSTEFFAIILSVTAGVLWYGTSVRSLIFAAALIVMLSAEKLLERPLKKLPKAVRGLMFAFFMLTILPFLAFPDVSDAFRYLTAMFGASHVAVDTSTEYLISSYFMFVVLCLLISGGVFRYFFKKKIFHNEYIHTIIQPVWVIALLIFCTAFLVSSDRQLYMYMF